MKSMIVAGGRDFDGSLSDFKLVRKMIKKYKIKIIVSGKASGADSFGEFCADILDLEVKPFPAKWNDLHADPCLIRTRYDGSQYNALAGMNRNRKMAAYTDYVFLFPGGSGTANMRKEAKAYNKKIVFDSI